MPKGVNQPFYAAVWADTDDLVQGKDGEFCYGDTRYEVEDKLDSWGVPMTGDGKPQCFIKLVTINIVTSRNDDND